MKALKDETVKTLDKIDRVITGINSALLVVAIFVMFLMIFANVIGRYCFSKSIMGADELARYLMISIAFLGMGLAMRQGQHSAFHIVQDAVPRRVRIGLRVTVAIILFAIMGTLMWLGWQYAIKYMANRTEMLRMPAGIWYMTIPVGALLFIFHFLFGLREYVFLAKNADLEAEIAAGNALVENSEFLVEGPAEEEE